MMKNACLLLGSLVAPVCAQEAPKPNIILIVADDLGYGELGCQGNPEIPTPHIDALAANGIRFTSGYVTAPVCSPSRAALMTGLYQSRFGYDNNPLSAMNDDPRYGLPEEMATFGNMMQEAGYITALIGKWHLGGAARYNPLRRGFDEFFGFLHEGHFYVPPPYEGVTSLLRRAVLPGGGEGRSPEGKLMYHTLTRVNEDPYDADNPILRGGTPVEEHEYLTDALTREAVSFIHRHGNQPFFLYLPYNAVHSPLQGADAYMGKMGHIEDIHRRIFAAMLANLDDGVGRVMAQLREDGLEENTLVFFISDNGGPTRELTSSNAPLRGGKGNLYEGGVRVPFIAQWKGHLPAGKTYDNPVISLDIVATAVHLAGLTDKELLASLEGENLIPFLTSENKGIPHETIYWRFGGQEALRQGNWKLIRPSRNGEFELYDLSTDLPENKDLASKNPEILNDLIRKWEEWNSGNIDPIFPPARRGPGRAFITPAEK